MAECFYYKDGKKINNVQDIIHEFFKDNFQLKNSAIFSAEEIQESTVKKLKNILGANAYNQSNQSTVTEFITSPNPALFSKLGINTKTDRLSPEYIEENRIYQYIIDNIDKAPSTNAGLMNYTPEKLEALLQRTDLQNIPESKLIYLLSEIEDIIAFENRTKNLGILLHEIISLKVQEKNYQYKIRDFLADPKNKEIIGEFEADE